MGDDDFGGFDPAVELDGVKVFHGDCIDVLKSLPDNSVDSIVTDPPYGLEFMGKDWDAPWKKSEVVEVTDKKTNGVFHDKGFKHGIRYNRGRQEMLAFQLWATEWSVECLRVLKAGGHLLAFGGTRTWHRLAVAVEDAGFEIRDNIAWMYGSGFPKSLDVSKAIDKRLGAEREVVGQRAGKGSQTGTTLGKTFGGENGGYNHGPIVDETAPATSKAKAWEGWGTALKPAHEPIVVARKPLTGTVAETVLEWGTGGLNIDGSRIGTGSGETRTVSYPDIRGDNYQQGKEAYSKRNTVERVVKDQGRWPANVILDEYTADLLDQQSGMSVSRPIESGGYLGNSLAVGGTRVQAYGSNHNDSGGASRFFYCAKASKRDRNEGLEDLEAQRHSDRNRDDGVGGDNPRNRTNQAKQNFHPTVKPTSLMRYLVKLVTPPGGTVLDPFTGSGSTGKAAILEGFEFVGVELTEDYLPIIEGRLKWALKNREEGTLF